MPFDTKNMKLSVKSFPIRRPCDRVKCFTAQWSGNKLQSCSLCLPFQYIFGFQSLLYRGSKRLFKSFSKGLSIKVEKASTILDANWPLIFSPLPTSSAAVAMEINEVLQHWAKYIHKKVIGNRSRSHQVFNFGHLANFVTKSLEKVSEVVHRKKNKFAEELCILKRL